MEWFFRSPPYQDAGGYQDASLSSAPSSRNPDYFGSSASSHISREDSNEWVWSNTPASNDRNEKKDTASSAPASSNRKAVENNDNLLIDFGERKTKTQTATTTTKVRSAEEEAWDMLNS